MIFSLLPSVKKVIDLVGKNKDINNNLQTLTDLNIIPEYFLDIKRKLLKLEKSRTAKEKRGIIAGLALEEESWQFEGCKKLITQFIEIRRNSRNKNFIEKQIREAEKKNDQELLLRLLSEKQNKAVLSQKVKISLQSRRIREA